MPATVPAQTVVVTRVGATNNFQFLFQSASGGLRFCGALLQADMATAAALGNGASATFTYTQDGAAVTGGTGPTKTDYPNGYVQETF